VRGERGRVQARRRPTVSALSGPVSIRRVDHHAFLAPPHRTERAVLHRRRPRHARLSAWRRALLELVAAVCEEQDTFRAWSAEQDQASLPQSLRDPATGSTTGLPP